MRKGVVRRRNVTYHRHLKDESICQGFVQALNIFISILTSIAAGATTATTTTTTTGVSEVDLDAATIEFLFIESIDGQIRLFLSGIRYEAKATRAVCIAIAHHDRVYYRTVIAEALFKTLIGRIPANGANEVWGKESKHETGEQIGLCRTDRKKMKTG